MTRVCYENRNGMVVAFDVETGKVVNPAGEDFFPGGLLESGERISDLPVSCLADFTPEDIRDELVKRGVTEVLVYTGSAGSWLDGSIPSYKHRLAKFAHMASQSVRAAKVWAAVPVARLADGSEWADVYRARR